MSRHAFKVEATGLGVVVEIRVHYADTATPQEVGQTATRAYATAVAEHDKRYRELTPDRRADQPASTTHTDNTQEK